MLFLPRNSFIRSIPTRIRRIVYPIYREQRAIYTDYELNFTTFGSDLENEQQFIYK